MKNSSTLELVSHHLCPYVQRAAITLAEKNVPFRRTDIDLAAKPEWFSRISPLGKVPLLRVGEDILFESAVICEYLDDTQTPRLHPADAMDRARHRAWIDFASTTLNAIWAFYTAPDAAAYERRRMDLANKFAWVEQALGAGPWFAGSGFSLVDAAFAPVFRYFDVFEQHADPRVFDATPKVRAWRRALAGRESVVHAVAADYPERLTEFLRARGSHLSTMMAPQATLAEA
jgi:glutathione S-transferase